MERFLMAQEAYYETALAEIKAGKKESHWMWFIFPQIDGLGYSEISQYYAIHSKREAMEYIAHPVLRKRLMEISVELLGLETDDAESVFGSVDAKKLQSSMTLFYEICGSSVFAAVLVKYFNGDKDWQTLERLNDMEVGLRWLG